MMELRLGSARYLTRGRHWPACLGLHAPEDGHSPLADMLSRVAEVHGHPRQMGTAQLTPCVTCMLPRQPVPVAAWLEQASSPAGKLVAHQATVSITSAGTEVTSRREVTSMTCTPCTCSADPACRPAERTLPHPTPPDPAAAASTSSASHMPHLPQPKPKQPSRPGSELPSSDSSAKQHAPSLPQRPRRAAGMSQAPDDDGW